MTLSRSNRESSLVGVSSLDQPISYDNSHAVTQKDEVESICSSILRNNDSTALTSDQKQFVENVLPSLFDSS